MRFFEQTYSYEEVYRDLNSLNRHYLDFSILMALATVISTFGLLLNNSVIIIGAMLIAPLMEPILGISFSSLTRNGRFALRSAKTLISGILLAILISYVLSIPFPNLSITDEVLTRTKPSLLDLYVALATGFIAGYAKIRKNLAGTIYGAAVAISLLPPLCVTGIGLALGRFEIYAGAALLFVTNIVSILFSSILAFLIIQLSDYKNALKSLILPGVSLALLAIPLGFSLYTIQQQKTMEAELTYILRMNTHTFKAADIITVKTDAFSNPMIVIVTMRGRESTITPKQVRMVEEYLQQSMDKPVILTVDLTPTVQIKAEPYTKRSLAY